MEEDVQRYFEHGLADSTKKTYQAGKKKFIQFCHLYAITNPLPVSQSLLCCYISYLAKSGLAYSTIKTYLSAIRHLQISAGLPAPEVTSMPKLSLVERGIRRLKSSEPGRTRLPITPGILRQLRALWSCRASEVDYIMIWAACCTAFFGFFRMGEITAPSPYSFNQDSQLTIADVAVDDSSNPMVLRIRLKRTKTQQFKAVDIYLGRTNDDLCPVAALLAYIAVRGMSAGPLFFFQDGRYLTKESFISWVRSALDTLGINSAEYAGHSFRIGAATTAAEQGIEDSVIKMLGRWESSAYQVYIQTSRELLAAMSKRLAAPPTQK